MKFWKKHNIGLIRILRIMARTIHAVLKTKSKIEHTHTHTCTTMSSLNIDSHEKLNINSIENKSTVGSIYFRLAL